MKPGEVQTYLPPPPHKIVDYLNGSIIGHNVMKKAISVAIYNHFCNINFSRYEYSTFQISTNEIFPHSIPCMIARALNLNHQTPKFFM